MKNRYFFIILILLSFSSKLIFSSDAESKELRDEHEIAIDKYYNEPRNFINEFTKNVDLLLKKENPDGTELTEADLSGRSQDDLINAFKYAISLGFDINYTIEGYRHRPGQRKGHFTENILKFALLNDLFKFSEYLIQDTPIDKNLAVKSLWEYYLNANGDKENSHRLLKILSEKLGVNDFFKRSMKLAKHNFKFYKCRDEYRVHRNDMKRRKERARLIMAFSRYYPKMLDGYEEYKKTERAQAWDWVMDGIEEVFEPKEKNDEKKS